LIILPDMARRAGLLAACGLATLSQAAESASPSRDEAARIAGDAPPRLEILPQPILTGLIHLPGLLVTSRDTVLVIAQSRIKRGDFDPSDIVIIRSLDQGRTWSPPVKLFDAAGTSRIGYSCVLVEDRVTRPNAVLAYYTVGPAPWKSHQLVWYGRRSTDEGATWSEPFPVLHDGDAESKPSNGGHGFQFPNGRLVLPGRGNLLFSDDGGTRWTTSGKAETVETKVVPLVRADGGDADSVYLITRRSTTYRVYGDRGTKLNEEGDHGNVYTTLGRNPGLARYSTRRDGPANVLLMSGLVDMKDRALSITFSLDEGRTWVGRKQIDAKGWYSDLGVTRDKTIIAAYTTGFSADLKIARFNFAWLAAP
jgi:hypothetical protein